MTDQIVPISFSQGLDEKTDSKNIPLGKMLVSENIVFTKQGVLQKRNGLDSLPKVVQGSLGVSQTIDEGQAIQSFEDQLLLFDGRKAFSYSDSSGKWSDKGTVASVINETFQVVRSVSQQENADGAKVQGFELYAWEDANGGIYYSVIDSETGNFVVSNQLLTLYGDTVKVLPLFSTSSLQAQFVILFCQASSLRMSRISVDNLSASPVLQTLTTNLHESHLYDACHSAALQTNGTTVSEFNSIFIAYAARATLTTVYPTPKVIQVTPTSASVLSTFTDATSVGVPEQIAMTPTTDMSSQAVALAGPTAVVLFHSPQNGFQVGKIGTAGIASVVSLALPPAFDIGSLEKMSIVVSEPQLVDKIHLKAMFEFQRTPAFYTYLKIADFSVQVAGAVVASSGFTNIQIRKGVGLYSKAFLHNGEVYFTSTHESYLQSTYFVLNSTLDVVSKFNQNNGGGLRTGFSEVISDGYSYSVPVSQTFSGTKVTHLLPDGNGIYYVPTQKKGKIESENNTVFSKLGIVRSTLDFVNENHFRGATLNDNLYTVGGILQNYDGNYFTEAGFNLYPEGSGDNHGCDLDSSQFNITVTIPGDSVTNQETNIRCVDATRLQPGDVIQINGALNIQRYYIWFTIDGVGVDPEYAGLIPLQVSISSFYTSSQVADAIAGVLNLVGEFSAITIVNTIVLTNLQLGASVAPAAISAAVGNMDAGTYFYTAIWKYIDNKGRVHASATAIPESITVAAPLSSVSVIVPVLDLTDKQKVILEVYRTEVNGQLFRRVSSTVFPTLNIDNEDYRFQNVSFVDTLSDADTLSNELLYTTGDVLDNDAFPPCSLITSYDGRLWLAGLEDKNALVFTKTIDPLDKTLVAGFSEAFQIDFLPQGGDIIAIAKLDEKLIVFKETEIYYISGVGPSNANDSNNYNPPSLISSDVGCSNPNSVVLTPTGLMFQTRKGIYQLDRSLVVSYIGAPVEKHNDLTISSAVLMSLRNQIRFTTEEDVCLVYDYQFAQWSTFTNYVSTDADVFRGTYVVLSSDGTVRQENQVFTDDGYGISLAFETGNMNFANIQGYQRFKRALLLGEYLGSHHITVSFAYDFSPVFTESTTFNMNTSVDTPGSPSVIYGDYVYGSVGPYGTSDGGVYGGDYEPYQFRIFPTQQKCTSFRIRVEDNQDDLDTIGEGLTISNISLIVAVKQGQSKVSSLRSQGTA